MTLSEKIDRARERLADAYVDEEYEDDENGELFDETVGAHVAYVAGFDRGMKIGEAVANARHARFTLENCDNQMKAVYLDSLRLAESELAALLGEGEE